MKKKYLEPKCKHLQLRGLQIMAGSFDISDEGTDDQWAKDVDVDGENTINSHSVWED